MLTLESHEAPDALACNLREDSPAGAADPSRPCRILVIEDNVDANETLNFCLTIEGHSVVSAFDGPAGLALAKDGGYDIVICDIGLPGMNGHEVLRQIRLLGAVPAPCCIAMTGYEQQDEHANDPALGFDHYLVKPVSIERLLGIVSKTFPSPSKT